MPQTDHYGSHPDQLADLFLPSMPNPPVVCLLHGGFWLNPYRRDQMLDIAHNLAGRGFAVWNLEYRRLGAGGDWPATFEDVIAGINHLEKLVATGIDLDLKRVFVAGHSAGGHLALWSASNNHTPRVGKSTLRVKISGVIGQAPVPDLVEAHRRNLGSGAVTKLLGGTPQTHADRYRSTSPAALLPLGIPQLIIHGAEDSAVPIDLVRDYAQKAAASGDPIDLHEIPNMGHMEFLDPTSKAHTTLCDWLNHHCS